MSRGSKGTPRHLTIKSISRVTEESLYGEFAQPQFSLGVTSGYIATVDSLVLAAAEKVSRYIDGAMNGETGKVLRLANQNTSILEAHV